MPTFDVTIDNKTYHVDIPWLNAGTLPLIVDGQRLEIVLDAPNGKTSHDGQGTAARTSAAPTSDLRPCKPVRAEWHATMREE